MFNNRRPPDDLQTTIDDARRSLTVPATRTPSAGERRGGDRRRMDRRGHENTPRRAEDAERNQHRRALLLSFLGTLSHDDLLLWIDRLWLGLATEPQIEALIASVREAPHYAERIASNRATDRPRGTGHMAAGPHALNNAWLNAEWRNLSEQLTVLASLRRQHQAPVNQKRNGSPKSYEYRNAALASPIGMRVVGARLFDEFFDRPELTPEEMAARLLHREMQTQLETLEAATHRHRRGFGSFTAAAAAVTALALFPRWRSMYRGLRDRTDSPTDDAPRN